jgi:hypothetical protein
MPLLMARRSCATLHQAQLEAPLYINDSGTCLEISTHRFRARHENGHRHHSHDHLGTNASTVR